jgi:hypothetical protein
MLSVASPPLEVAQRKRCSAHLALSAQPSLPAQAAAEAEAEELRSNLEATNDLLIKAMATATEQAAAAAEAAAAKQRELDAALARLAEAAGILNIKDELRETK